MQMTENEKYAASLGWTFALGFGVGFPPGEEQKSTMKMRLLPLPEPPNIVSTPTNGGLIPAQAESTPAAICG